jgi:hypothetical protein
MKILKTFLTRTTLVLGVLAVMAIVFGGWRLLDRQGIETKYRLSPAKIGDVSAHWRTYMEHRLLSSLNDIGRQSLDLHEFGLCGRSCRSRWCVFASRACFMPHE